VITNALFSTRTMRRGALQNAKSGTAQVLIPVFLFGVLAHPAHAVQQTAPGFKPFSVTPHRPGSHRFQWLDLHGTHWVQIAHRHGLDPYLLYAVALTESARIRNDLAHPWVWALNRGGKSVYPESSAEALEQIRNQIKSGSRNIDIGLMQVNLRWHRHRVGEIEDLLDPVTNIELGAQILQESIATAPGDLLLGVGRYHAWSNSSEARKYGDRVLRLADRLRSIAKRGG
jgi:hypothetical protein